ncbi:MAG: aminotransferase class V-fold PLP-dependent enzyme, partial [Zoogloeaceae bacterium]|nr:aminotransferase class V-fold PLP-dependent enzyme [Zoogloeaceae bacterium]
MTIPTPTSEATAAGLPAQLPDLAVLNQLAAEFFAALPGSAAGVSALPTPPAALGGVPLPANVLPGGTALGPLANGPQLPGTLAPGANLVPNSPHTAGAAVASTPSLISHSAAPNGLPDNGAIVPPALDGRAGGVALGVPEAHAADLPATDASPHGVPASASHGALAPHSPFYFLHDAGGYPGPAGDLAIPQDDRVTPQSFGLPGADALRTLLADKHQSAAAPQHRAGSFYFLEPAKTRSSSNAPVAAASAHPPFDVHAIRRDFPILQERINGQQLVWFDNAATTHKPQAVIDRLAHFYAHENSNIHRAAHELAARATDAYEGARDTVARFIGAGSSEEIIFVRGTTEAINLVAKSWGA